MYIYNITFVVTEDKETEVIDYIKDKLLNELFESDLSRHKPELRKVIEINGSKPDLDHGLSLALSASFESMEKAHIWNEEILTPSLEKFFQKFSPESLYFITLLQTISLHI